MSRLEVEKKLISNIADKLEKEKPLTIVEKEYLVRELRKSAEGESAKSLIQLKRRPGEKKSDEPRRRKISFILHLVASYHKPFVDPRIPAEEQARPMTLQDSINKVLPIVRDLMGDGHRYEFEQVRSWWYDDNKTHMKSPLRGSMDRDNPYAL